LLTWFVRAVVLCLVSDDFVLAGVPEFNGIEFKEQTAPAPDVTTYAA